MSVNIAITDIGDSTERYEQKLAAAGAQAVRFKYVDSDEEATKIAAGYGGLLLPGGCDVNPALFGQSVKSWCKKIDDDRDRLEYRLIRAFYEARKPMLGICRGEQILNIFFGGDVYQDTLKECEGALDHWHDDQTDKPCHSVTLKEGSLVASIYGASELEVNSIHHQACARTVPPLQITAKASDGVSEAVEMPEYGRFFLGLQWHPERMPLDSVHLRVFQAFVADCARD